MTWVVGASTIWGYGALYSDVQVTLRDGSTRDVLRKAYPVANAIAAGFAGSVRIGFSLIQSLEATLIPPPGTPQNALCHPVLAANGWAPIAKSVFESAETRERALGSRILMVGVSPNESAGLGAKVYFARFASPEFVPQVMTRTVKICSIGTGASIRQYKHSIKPLFRLSSGILHAEVGSPFGWGVALGYSIANATNWYPHSGISQHVHTTLIARDGFRYANSDQKTYRQDGVVIERKMPPLAESYDQFLAMLSVSGSDTACAVS